MENATSTSDEDGEENRSTTPLLVTDSNLLLQYGVVSRIPIISDEINASAWKKWATDLSVVSPCILTSEGDGEYAFYRNILDEPEFPFDSILRNPSIRNALIKYFNILSLEDDEIKLDDAFCIHYNMQQTDTSGAKHVDPSDITINLCLDKSDDCKGSQVLFHGTKKLHNIDSTVMTLQQQQQQPIQCPSQFLVNQEMGYATMHWGEHPHETTALQAGYRTNIILTYCYSDKSRSTVAQRSCYNV